ncbi:MAG: glycoside hydrolase family 3 protein, partial [Clostridia bacterium]|nr:glycoside hydrolase family 3 protein [Clostridia bacterium]
MNRKLLSLILTLALVLTNVPIPAFAADESSASILDYLAVEQAGTPVGLDKGFSPGITDYATTVSNSTMSIDIKAQAVTTGSIIELSGKNVTTSSAMTLEAYDVALELGLNKFELTVSDEDHSETMYTLNVTRGAPEGSFVVSFDLNGADETAPAPLIVQKGARVTLPSSNPTREGYIFAGWYTAPGGGQYEAFNTTAAIEADTVLYAQWIQEDHVNYIKTTHDGKTVTLGYSTYSGVKIRKMSDDTEVSAEELASTEVGYGVYKDLNGNGVLDDYEDWTKDVSARTADIAQQMSYKEIAGLMLFSSHQRTWTSPIPTQAQVTFLANDDLRHVLIAGEIPAEVAAPWNNNIQAMNEKFGLGVPANNSSDPRHSAAIGVEYYSSNTGTISLWPNTLGLAATFDPTVMLEFAKIASAEYRALGITTALSPQIDISTDPRWSRLSGTFGEDPKLAADMTEAYVQGFQGTFNNGESLLGWGKDSVNAMIKHWPGGGGGEAGRDAHNDLGKYAVFAGNNFDAHVIPFVDGGLQGTIADTTMASAVMPYYTINFNVDPTGQDFASAFSEYMITDLLRDKFNFDGVICTDWGVDATRGWGTDIEDLSIAERSRVLIEAGVNQFGGRNTPMYILEAAELAKAEGYEAEELFRTKMEESAKKLLTNVFLAGLFENPYLDEEYSKEFVANDEFVAKGQEAQVKSVVMVKNHEDILPLTPTTKVYVPKGTNGNYLLSGANKHFTVVDTPTQADIAIVPINSPVPVPATGGFGGGWTQATGYVPLPLQYSEYTAVHARDVSIGGDFRNFETGSKILNRTYKNKKSTAQNLSELEVLLNTKEEMGNKPVIAVVNVSNPMVFKEVDAVADGIVVRFASSDNSVLDIISGKSEPSGLLPVQMPKNMETVEKQLEDTPRDMACYEDSDGNVYDFAFGLNWSGVINDARTAKYNVTPLTHPQSGHITDVFAAILTHTLPAGKINETYNAEIKAVENNLTFTLLNPDKLPSGLSFNNGVISGTPTVKTHEYGDQLNIKVTGGGKEEKIFRITLLINETGAINLADPNELSIALTLAKAKVANNYEAADWAIFSQAYETAKSTYADASAASQEEIDSAEAVLMAAMNKLDGIEGGGEGAPKFQIISQVFEYGHDAVAIAIDTGEVVSKDTVNAANFTVKNGDDVLEIKNAYVNTEANMDSTKVKTEGRYIILELSNGYSKAGYSLLTFEFATFKNTRVDLSKFTVTQGSETYSLNAAKPEIALIVDNFVAKEYKYNQGGGADTLKYRFYTPEGLGTGEKVPLVLWIHGMGEGGDGTDAGYNGVTQILGNMGGTGWVEAAGLDPNLKAFVVAPQAYNAWDWRNAEEERVDVKRIDGMLKEVIASNPNIDTDRIYVAGCSMGGGQTFAQLIYSKTESSATQFAAAFPICPAYELTAADAEIIKDIPMAIIQSKDDTTVSTDSVRESVNKLVASGAKKTQYIEYDNVIGKDGTTQYQGHWSWVRVLNNQDNVMQWLFNENRTYIVAATQLVSPKPTIATVNQNKTVTLGWTAIEGVSGYNVYKRVPGASWFEPAVDTKLNTNGIITETTFTTSALQDGSHTFLVTAVKGTDESVLSASKLVQATIGDTSGIAAPTAKVQSNYWGNREVGVTHPDLTANNISSGKVKVHYTIDGSVPTSSSPEATHGFYGGWYYGTTIAITRPSVMKIIIIVDGVSSEVGAVNVPPSSPAAMASGVYNVTDLKNVTIKAEIGSKVYYTTGVADFANGKVNEAQLTAIAEP